MKHQRLFTRRIERLILLLVLLFGFSAVMPVQAAPRVYRIQYTPSPSGAHMVIGFEGYDHSPKIEVVNGRLGTVSIAGQDRQFHGTVAVRLDWCDSWLTLDGQIVAQQRCARLPWMAKN